MSQMASDNDNSRTALIVEDCGFQRQLLHLVCDEAGYHAIEATNGIEGLAALKENRVDLIITDLEMPKMDGLQFLHKLSEKKIKAKIIVSTSHPMSVLNAAEELAHQFGLQVIGALHKPFVPERFLSLLKQAALLDAVGHLDLQHLGEFQGKLSAETVKDGIENGAITTYYQPKVTHTRSNILGLECLARWRMKNGKILSPASFIPTAEEHGLMASLTDTIIDQALGDMAGWQKKGRDIVVSINISVDNLRDRKFPDRLHKRTKTHKIEPSSIILEVTETKAIEHIADCLEVMSRLRLKGFGLSIDDFGTGYASLKQLQYSPFTELKLDRSYVVAAVRHGASHAVLQSGIKLAQDLGLSCIAEGVETDEQAEMLEAMGCERHQGFLYAKPLPGSEILPWIADWASRHRAPTHAGADDHVRPPT